MTVALTPSAKSRCQETGEVRSLSCAGGQARRVKPPVGRGLDDREPVEAGRRAGGMHRVSADQPVNPGRGRAQESRDRGSSAGRVDKEPRSDNLLVAVRQGGGDSPWERRLAGAADRGKSARPDDIGTS